MPSKPVVVTIAGFDPCGSAGILADIKTFAANGCYGLAVITANTVQNSCGVKSVMPLPADFILSQLEALKADISFNTIKIGMLATPEIVEAVILFLTKYRLTHVVLDPVISSSSGHALLIDEAVVRLKEELFPLTTLITPNLAEASRLSGIVVNDLDTMQIAAAKLSANGAQNILIKGGHLSTKAIDLLYYGSQCEIFSAEKLPLDAHGTGCTLSSAIAAFLAQDLSLIEAVKKAKDFLTNRLQRPLILGKGAPLIDHL